MYRDRTNELLKQESEMVVLKTDLDRARVHSSLLGYHLVTVREELEKYFDRFCMCLARKTDELVRTARVRMSGAERATSSTSLRTRRGAFASG